MKTIFIVFSLLLSYSAHATSCMSVAEEFRFGPSFIAVAEEHSKLSPESKSESNYFVAIARTERVLQNQFTINFESLGEFTFSPDALAMELVFSLEGSRGICKAVLLNSSLEDLRVEQDLTSLVFYQGKSTKPLFTLYTVPN